MAQERVVDAVIAPAQRPPASYARHQGATKGEPGTQLPLLLNVDAVEDWPEPIVMAAVRVPDLERVLSGRKAPQWLLDEVKQRARSRSDYERAAAVGLLARLADPAALGLEHWKDLAAAFGRGEFAHDWFISLPEKARRRVEVEALDEADSLEDAVASLERLLKEDKKGAAAFALDWLHRRDLLESALFLWGQEPRDPVERSALSVRLRRLDRIASHHHTTWMDFAFRDDAWLARVAAAEPDAWWSALSVR